ncbi:hypothetical protein ACP4OV_028509 [Aristida adscensionis]
MGLPCSPRTFRQCPDSPAGSKLIGDRVCCRVDGCCCLIKNKNFVPAKKNPSKAKELTLSNTPVITVITHYQSPQNRTGHGDFSDLPYILVGVQAKGIQIIAHGSPEKCRFLRRNNELISVDFPLPVLPTTPILFPAANVQVIPLRTSGAFARSILPSCGQVIGGLFSSIMAGGSEGRCIYCLIRSTDMI